MQHPPSAPGTAEAMLVGQLCGVSGAALFQKTPQKVFHTLAVRCQPTHVVSSLILAATALLVNLDSFSSSQCLGEDLEE